MQKIVDEVIGLHGVVQADLADAGSNCHIGTDPKFVRSSDEVRL